MKGSHIAGLIIGLIIIIAAIIVIVILVQKRNKTTKSQEVVIDNGEVANFAIFSKANLKKRFNDARKSPISNEALSKASRLYGEVPSGKLEKIFENNIPYDYISEIDKFNTDIAKYFPENRSQPDWIEMEIKQNGNSRKVKVPKTFSYVLYDTINGDLKKVYINPPEGADYNTYDTLGDFLAYHISSAGPSEVGRYYFPEFDENGKRLGNRKVDIDLSDSRLSKLSQLKDIYDSFKSSNIDNFDEYLYNTEDDIESMDQARARAEAIIEVLTKSPYEWATTDMINAWNNESNESINARYNFKHPAIYIMSSYI